LRIQQADYDRLRSIYVELEFNNLAKMLPQTSSATGSLVTLKMTEGIAARTGEVASGDTAVAAPVTRPVPNYRTVDSLAELETVIARARVVEHIAIDTEVVLEPGAPDVIDPLRSR